MSSQFSSHRQYGGRKVQLEPIDNRRAMPSTARRADGGPVLDRPPIHGGSGRAELLAKRDAMRADK